MKTELSRDTPVCSHDFSVADESIAWLGCSSAEPASSSIHGAKLNLSLESTIFSIQNVALRFGIYTIYTFMHLDWNLLASGLLKQAVSGGAVVKSPYPATAKKNTEERQ